MSMNIIPAAKMGFQRFLQTLGIMWNKMVLNTVKGFTEFYISFSPLTTIVFTTNYSFSLGVFLFLSVHSFLPLSICLLLSFSFHPSNLSFFLACSTFEFFSFSECSGWKVRAVRMKSTSLLLCVCVCVWMDVCVSEHTREQAELLKWDWSTGSSWEG